MNTYKLLFDVLPPGLQKRYPQADFIDSNNPILWFVTVNDFIIGWMTDNNLPAISITHILGYNHNINNTFNIEASFKHYTFLKMQVDNWIDTWEKVYSDVVLPSLSSPSEVHMFKDFFLALITQEVNKLSEIL